MKWQAENNFIRFIIVLLLLAGINIAASAQTISIHDVQHLRDGWDSEGPAGQYQDHLFIATGASGIHNVIVDGSTLTSTENGVEGVFSWLDVDTTRHLLFAYEERTPAIHCYDLSNPDQLVLRSVQTLTEDAHRFVLDDILLIVDDDEYIWVFNTSNPDSLVTQSVLDEDQDRVSISFDSDVLAICNDDNFYLIDLTSPANPVWHPVNTDPERTSLDYILVDGNLLYLGHHSVSLQVPVVTVFNIEDLGNPDALDEIEITSQPRWMSIHENELVVSGSSWYSILDISDPLNLTSLYSEILHTGIFSVSSDYLIHTFEKELILYFLADIANPVQIAQLVQDSEYHDIEFSEEYAWVAKGDQGVGYYALTQEGIQELAVFPILGFAATDLRLRGDRLYVIQNFSMNNPALYAVLDVSDPMNPVQLHSGMLPTGSGYGTWFTSRALLTIVEREDDDVVKVIDITNPASPVERDQIVETGNPAEIVTVDDLAYIRYQSQSTSRIRLFDLSDPAQVERIGYSESYSIRAINQTMTLQAGELIFNLQYGDVFTLDCSNPPLIGRFTFFEWESVETGKIQANSNFFFNTTYSGLVNILARDTGAEEATFTLAPGRARMAVHGARVYHTSGHSLDTYWIGYGDAGLEDKPSELPAVATLASPWPNPFNSTVTIQYTLPHQEEVQLSVFNTLGQIVTRLLDGTIPAGTQRIQWSPSGASGVYIVQLHTAAGTFSQQRILYLK